MSSTKWFRHYHHLKITQIRKHSTHHFLSQTNHHFSRPKLRRLLHHIHHHTHTFWKWCLHHLLLNRTLMSKISNTGRQDVCKSLSISPPQKTQENNIFSFCCMQLPKNRGERKKQMKAPQQQHTNGCYRLCCVYYPPDTKNLQYFRLNFNFDISLLPVSVLWSVTPPLSGLNDIPPRVECTDCRGPVLMLRY